MLGTHEKCQPPTSAEGTQPSVGRGFKKLGALLSERERREAKLSIRAGTAGRKEEEEVGQN